MSFDYLSEFILLVLIVLFCWYICF